MQKCCVGEKAEKDLRLTVEFLKLIAEENRLKILDIPQNLASHHLKALKEYGLISSRKEGLNIYYSLNTDSFNNAKSLLNAFLTGKKRAC
jgi:DNA-binding transcriptional ArsR family regulator